MKYRLFLLVAMFSGRVLASPAEVVTPSGQNLVAVEYSSSGKQSGCGLRATGVTPQNLSLNILITVFLKSSGGTFGVVKVVARNVEPNNGIVQDGDATYKTLGKIRKAWIKPDAVSPPRVFKNGQSLHNDAYMVSTEFTGTVELITAMSRANFRVGLNRSGSGADEVFQFNQRINAEQGAKLSLCMSNLRSAIEESKTSKSF
ncbi:MAG: hypothetical protein WA632_15380 [Gallionella sp.]